MATDIQGDQTTIYVNRIPKEATEDELRTVFQNSGTIESVRFAGGRFNRRPGSAQTRYAFIKFQHPEEASAAVEFDKQLTLHDSVLDVELATPMGPRPRNRSNRNRPRANGSGYQGVSSGGGNESTTDSGLKSVQQQLARLQNQEKLLTQYYTEQHRFFTSQINALKKHVASSRQHEEDQSGDESHPPGHFQDAGQADYN